MDLEDRTRQAQKPWQMVRVDSPLFVSSGIVPNQCAGDFSLQFDDILGQMKDRLDGEGLTFADLVAVDVYLQNIRRDFEIFGVLWRKTFGANPAIARVTTQAVLRHESWLIELRFIAQMSSSRRERQ